MLNPYIKHGTFILEFDDRIKTIQGNWFILIRNKTIFKNDLKKIISLMLNYDITFKGIISWFENTT